MKKVFLMILGVAAGITLQAQVLQSNESAIVYYSPKTEIVLDFSYTVEKHVAGPFAAYAEELLGARDVVAADSMVYQLENVKISTHTSTDFNRPHKVRFDADIPMLLTLNEKQILVGYNMPKTETQAARKPQHKEKERTKQSLSVPPFTDEVLKAGDSTGLAEAVAQQILHLRETRSYLLSGEVEHAPADGNAMKQVLAQLDKQEQALTELFVGKRCCKTEHQLITLQPEQAEQLLFFCTENGFTDGDNIDADTIRVNIALMAQSYLQPEEEAMSEEPAPKSKKNKKELQKTEPELSPIVYNLPGSAEVKVLYQNRIMAGKTIPVAQAGIDVPLPKYLFTSELPVILFNEKTGNIISISK